VRGIVCAPLELGFQVAQSLLKGSLSMKKKKEFAKTLRALPFMEDLSIDIRNTFS
jgi:hypothetical protein